MAEMEIANEAHKAEQHQADPQQTEPQPEQAAPQQNGAYIPEASTLLTKCVLAVDCILSLQSSVEAGTSGSAVVAPVPATTTPSSTSSALPATSTPASPSPAAPAVASMPVQPADTDSEILPATPRSAEALPDQALLKVFAVWKPFQAEK